MISEIICLVLVYLGVFLMFMASLGLFRLPDIYTRMSAVTKAVTFKIGLIMLGCCIYFNTLPVVINAVLVVFFLLLTTPVSSHLIGREAYLLKMPLWKKTIKDEYKEEVEKEEKAEEEKRSKSK
ncbi:MAG: monovalent cation/H(+) antiporter subunit G [Chitinophagales bacterium]